MSASEGRARGFAFLEGAVYPGTLAVDVAFPANSPIAAISVAAVSSRLDEARKQPVAADLQRHVAPLARVLSSGAACRLQFVVDPDLGATRQVTQSRSGCQPPTRSWRK